MVQLLQSFVLLTAILLVAVELGFRAGVRRRTDETDDPEPERIAATFVHTLLGLILAFTLHTARGNFADRANIILTEAQAIRSARLALDDLEGGVRDSGLALLTEYVENKKK